MGAPHKLTVSGLYQPGWHYSPSSGRQAPLLMLSGRWLEEAGFWMGRRVLVEVDGRDRLVVTAVDDTAEES